MSLARITSKGQITIPKEVRDRLGVEPGDQVEFQFEEQRLMVRPVRRRHLAEFRGLFRGPESIGFTEERKTAWDTQVKRLHKDDETKDA